MPGDNGKFAMVNRDMILHFAGCPPCGVLWLWLEEQTGGRDWTRSITNAAAALGWQPRTVDTHATHLATAKLIELTQDGPKASARMAVSHQPLRGLLAAGARLDVPTPVTHVRRPTIRERERIRERRDGIREERVCPETEAYAQSAYAPGSGGLGSNGSGSRNPRARKAAP